MKKVIYVTIVMMSFIVCSCQKQVKNVEEKSESSVEASEESTDGIDPMSPYHYAPNQKEVTFSDDGHTLLRYPHDIKESAYTIPPEVDCIFDRAFLGCRNLKEVTIPKTVKEIQMAAFDDCRDLERVFLYAKLDTMPFRFLNCCEKLKEIHVACKVPPVVEEYEEDEMFNFKIVFGSLNLDSLVLYVPKGSVGKYKRAYGWRLFRNISPQAL